MDRACDGDATRARAEKTGFQMALPPRSDRRGPWVCDREPCKRRLEVEQRFRRPRGCCRSHTRYDKQDVMDRGFIVLTPIMEALRVV